MYVFVEESELKYAANIVLNLKGKYKDFNSTKYLRALQ